MTTYTFYLTNEHGQTMLVEKRECKNPRMTGTYKLLKSLFTRNVICGFGYKQETPCI